ncbi:MAG: RNA-binding protein [Methylocella sp.]
MPIGPKGEKRPRDPNQLAKLIIDIATGQVEDREPPAEEQGKALTSGGGDKKPRKRTPPR